ARLARAVGAEIELFHALDPRVNFDALLLNARDWRRREADQRARCVDALDRLAAEVVGVKATTAAEWDFPSYEAIVRRAQRIGADLIVAERHGGPHLAPHLLHLTDWELLRLSPVPVLLVKDPHPYRKPVVLAAIDPVHAFDKPGRLDEDILGCGKTLARALRGRLHVMHAYQPLSLSVPAEAWAPGVDLTAALRARAAARASAGMRRALRSTRLPRGRCHLVARHPLDAIPDTARRTRSAIVVMGSVSRSGLKRLFIGNTAEQVLDRLACDLLVIKPREFRSAVPRAVRSPRLALAAARLAALRR
ncbi:MAG TPA: universal stress protein, partial [Steroidobacteraceae bacterium]|nr:universal stress protein [Steroidobacteraceae bacterium]